MPIQHTRFIEQSALKSLIPSSVSWAQLERGTLDVRYQLIDTGLLRISHRRLNLAVRFSAEMEPNRIGVMRVFSPFSHAHWFGVPCESGAIAIGGDELDIRTGGDTTLEGIAIDANGLQSQFPDSPDASHVAEKLKRFGITRNPLAASRLSAAVHATFSGIVTTELASGTIIPLLAEILTNFDDHRVERTQCLNRRLTAVRACEAYMREHVDSTLTLSILSQVTRMRSRSLINAFEAITGYSPMDYLKRLRLNGVYTRLRRADRAQTRIIDVAMDWGFWHMGHFTTDYRSMFGETPSETLLNN